MKSILYIFLLLFSNGVLCSQDSLEIQKHFSRFLDYTIQVKYSKDGLEWKIPSRYYPENHKSLRDLYVLFQGFDDNKYNNIDTLITQIKASMNSAGLKSNLNYFCVMFYKCNDTFLQALFHSGILGTEISSLYFVQCAVKSLASLSNQKKFSGIVFRLPKDNKLPSDFGRLEFEDLSIEDADSIILPEEIQKIQELKSIALKNIQHVILGNLALPSLKVLLLLSNHKNVLDSVLHNLDIFPNLEDLQIEYTIMDSLPSSITRLKYLNGLTLEGVGLSKVPDFLCEFDKLYRLSLRNLPIKTIPVCLSGLNSLSYINLQDTPHLNLSADLLQEFKRKKIQLILDERNE